MFDYPVTSALLMTSCMWMTMTSACPEVCDCTGTTVVCSGRGISRIPADIPMSTQILHLQRNNITELTAEDFSRLPRLKMLHLERNQITSVDPHTFEHQLELKTLLLNHNRLPCLPDKTFRTMKKLQVLTLDNNHLESLPYQLLRNNMLHLRTFRLHTNPLKCDCHLKWLADWLKRRPRLALFSQCDQPAGVRGSNLASADRKFFTCNELVVDRRPKCTNFVCPTPCTCEDGVVDCRHRGLHSLPPSFPRDSTELRLEQNNINTIPALAFSNYKLLTRIDVSNNDIREIEADAFHGLDRLTSLVMYGNKIEQLPQASFSQLRSLQMLLLNANKISCLQQNAFDGLQSLTLLSLYDNKLQTLPKGIFDNLPAIETLHLANNPLRCDCHLRWLSKYLKKRPVETSGVRCSSPPRVSGKKIMMMRPKRYRCGKTDASRAPPDGSCPTSGEQTECPKWCECDGRRVTCSHARLTSVPDRLPSHITELILTHNNIKSIRNDGRLRKLSWLKKLDLSDNQISTIEDGAFTGAANLVDLRLNDNLLSDVRSSMFDGLKNLRMLMVRNNHLTCIGNHSFAGLTTLNHLSLYGNQISTITEGSFDDLRSIQTLNILANPLMCDCALAWFSTWLRSRRLASGNPRCRTPQLIANFPLTDLQSADFRCAPDPRAPGHTCAPVRKCPDQCSCEGTIVRCSNARLTSVPVERIPDDVTQLYLAMNQIREIPDDINRFTRLTTLDLSENRIRSLKNGIFRNLTQVTTLLLAYNQLRCIPRRAFAGLHSVNFLSLHGNELSGLPEGAFDDFFQISRVGLGANPWHCDCNLRWLIEKIEGDESGIARCSGPLHMTGRLLFTSPPRAFRCQGPLDIEVAAKCNPCLSSPCKFNSTCSLHATDYYQCDCLPGFKGRHCEQPIDPCILNPCHNGAACLARNEKIFTCVCATGWEGDRCERNIDDCAETSCPGDHVTCVDGVDNFTCACAHGWTGENCDVEVLGFCQLNQPCANNGTCVSSSSTSYRCECAEGYAGENCTEQATCPGDHKCENGASCEPDINTSTRYRCICRHDYSGEFCSIFVGEKVNILQDDPCFNHECLNGGSCYVTMTSSSDYQCRCLPGFSGERCENLTSLSFGRNGSYVLVDTPQLMTSYRVTSSDESEHNLTLFVSTTQTNGILMYWGEIPGRESDYLALELFSGHVRLNFDLGELPGSAMYSPVPINDGATHRVEIVVVRSWISLRVDDGGSVTQQLRFDQRWDGSAWLHVGGVSEMVLRPAVELWYFRNSTSFHGCLHALFLNRRLHHFDVDRLRGNTEHVIAGCDGCAASCVRGSCVFRDLHRREMACACEDGFGGPECAAEISRQCPPESCNGRGSCSYNGGIPTCTCQPGYQGDRCQERNPCADVDCGRGTCVPTPSPGSEFSTPAPAAGSEFSTPATAGSEFNPGSGFKCQCNRHFTGPTCRIRVRKCQGTKVRQFHKITRARSSVTSSSSVMTSPLNSTTQCRSVRRFTNIVCGGTCATSMSPFRVVMTSPEMTSSCCAPWRVQNKSLLMRCDDGTETTQTLRKVRSCACRERSSLMTSSC